MAFKRPMPISFCRGVKGRRSREDHRDRERLQWKNVVQNNVLWKKLWSIALELLISEIYRYKRKFQYGNSVVNITFSVKKN